MENFDAKSVLLDGSNLIEASAGTGKTYSVAIIVLRLIIEKKIPIEKILMVTFTNAAVDELETRIRKFIRQGYKYATGNNNENPDVDEDIREVVRNAGLETSKTELEKAVHNLDQLSVMTIHSFCEQSLKQYPFETDQSFEMEIATDISNIVESVVNEFWRKDIATLDKELFSHFTRLIDRDMIREVISKSLDNKEYLCEEIDPEELLTEIVPLIENTEAARHEYEDLIIANFDDIKTRELQKNPKKFVDANSGSAIEFMAAFQKKYEAGTGYLQTSFPEEFRACDTYLKLKTDLDERSEKYIFHLFKTNIEILREKVSRFKNDNRLIDFNDQIELLRKAVEKKNVNPYLSEQFDAVFIDEFQDTDKDQYKIFSELFSDEEKIVFYIGDPKQSIYGWRKADIATYKKAGTKVQHGHEMDTNFRSTKALTDSLNNFFSIENPFSDTDIKYEEVKAGREDLGQMTEDGVEVSPLDIYSFENKRQIEEYVVQKVLQLVGHDSFRLNNEKIKYSDIVVIVRTNKQGKAYKQAFSELDIPAITIDETRVMDSEEATMVNYLMEAVIHPNRGAINRVLLNECFGLNTLSITELKEEKHLDNFRELKLTWNTSGVYNMLFQFFDMYNVREYSLKLGVQGQRILTNLYQIAEILHQSESQKKFTPAELWSWSLRIKEDENDEYQQRIESQDEAVKIITIHKCKGLTFKIVIAPHLDLVAKQRPFTKYPIYEFREEGKYKFTHKPGDEQKQLWAEQITQENKRLIYVALTRAQYKVHLCESKSPYFKRSSLKEFIQGKAKEWIPPENLPSSASKDDEYAASFAARSVPSRDLTNAFRIHSFSALSSAHHSAPFEKAELGKPDNYDQFIFQDLSRGANAGTALHSIFERLDFNTPSTWDQTLQDASNYYSTIIEKDNLGLFKQMVHHAMNARIEMKGEKFRLNEIKPDQMLPEMQFYFSIDGINKTEINELLGNEAELSGESDLEGLMTGFIDLIFELNGKYYILDWKSNHLGNKLEDYGPDQLEEAMKASNYNLQYLIYTVALKRWLESRIPDFDYYKHFGGVLYVFLRGTREGQETGIYKAIPDREDIEKLDRAFKK